MYAVFNIDKEQHQMYLGHDPDPTSLGAAQERFIAHGHHDLNYNL